MSSVDEKTLINGLFDRLQQAEQQSGERDSNAAQLIKSRLKEQPAAPYYMAQTILIQEAALKRLNERVERLEQQVQQNQRSSGGFLSGLFGGGNNQASSGGQGGWGNNQAQPGWNRQNTQPGWGSGPAAQPQPQMGAPMGGGRSFLSGALQTATGVAGGMVLGNMLTHMFSGHSGEDIVGNDASNFGQDSFDQGYEDGMMDAHQDGLDAAGQGFGADQGMADNGGIDDFGGSDFDDFSGDDF